MDIQQRRTATSSSTAVISSPFVRPVSSSESQSQSIPPPSKDASAHKLLLCTFGALLVADLAVSIVFYVSTHRYSSNIHDYDELSSASSFFSSLFNAFSTSAIDHMSLTFFRVLIIIPATILAIRLGTPEHERDAEKEAQAHREDARRREMRQALLTEDPESANTDKILTEAEKRIQIKDAHWKRSLVLVIIFVITTWHQMQTGIKMVIFDFSSTASQAPLMGASILAINLELWFARTIVEKLTKEAGYLFKDLHPHRLYYDETIVGHWCDLCRARIRFGYSCRQCDFDLCMNCFKRKNKNRGEGLIRGDKGARDEEEITSRQYMIRALKLAKPHVGVILLAVICLVATSTASLLLPNYQGSILDSVIHDDKSGFEYNVKFYLGISIATGFFGAVRSLAFNIVGSYMANDVRNTLFKSIMIQDIAFFDGVTTGELTSRLTNDANAMVAPCQTVLSSFLSNAFSLFGGIFFCFYTSWRLSILAITSIWPIISITRAYASWSRVINRQIWAALGDASGVATQAIGNIRTVRAFGTERQEIAKYQVSTTEAVSKGIRDAYVGAGTYALTNYLDLGTSVLLLWYGGSVVMDKSNELTVGKLITFQLYWNMINSAYSSLVGVLNSFTRAGGAAQRVLSLMDNQPDINPDVGEIVTNIKGDLELRDVNFYYQMRPDNKVLTNVNLKIGSGQVCALVGRSGGGKSTIVHLLMRLYDPKSGEILLDGKPLTDINLYSLHNQMAVVAQDTQLFAGTIKENITYGCHDWTEADMIEAARQANAHDFIMQFEDHYDTRVGERGTRLSGGQRQRIAIARAFLRKARLLFLDEATSSLDTEAEAQVQAAIDKLIATSGCTVVLVAHRLSTVVNADQIAVIDKGCIVESGNHNSLLAYGGIYAKLVQRQLERQRNIIDTDDVEKRQNAEKESDTIDSLIDGTRKSPAITSTPAPTSTSTSTSTSTFTSTSTSTSTSTIPTSTSLVAPHPQKATSSSSIAIDIVDDEKSTPSTNTSSQTRSRQANGHAK